MATGGVAGNVDSVRVAPKALCVAIYPRYRSASLFGHRYETAFGLDHIDEVGHHIMCAGVDEQLSRVGEILGETPAPRPTMNEDVDWRVRALGRVDI